MELDWEYRSTVLALATLANFTQLGSRLALSPLVPDIITTFAVSKATVGLALTGMWAAYALAQFPSGLLGDRFGERRIVFLALALLGTASATLALAQTFVLFGVLVVALGAGAGLFYPVAASLLTGLYENTGGSLGVMTAGGSVAGLVTPIAAVAASAHFGWQAGVALGAALALPTLALFAWKVRPTDSAAAGEHDAAAVDPRAVFGVLARPPVAFTTLLSICTVFGFQAFTSFFPTFLVEYRALTRATASLAFGTVFLISAVMLPVMGELSDRVGRDPVLVAAFVLTGSGLAVLLVDGPWVLVPLGILLMGLGFSWAGVMQARFMDVFTPGERGRGFGLVRTIYMFVGASGSVVTGGLADAYGWLPAYGLVVSLFAAVVAALGVNRALGLGL